MEIYFEDDPRYMITILLIYLSRCKQLSLTTSHMQNLVNNMRTVQVTRYITPLREGGSLPALAEADDGFMYVLKFKGAGQGAKALIADLVGAELARLAGLKVPELVFAHLDEAFGRTEPDEEIQDLLRASEGINLGVHYLGGSISYDPAVSKVDSLLASTIVWLDAFITNVDRTARNTNMLSWHQELWLIDFGASLYFHHAWDNWQEQSLKPFLAIKEHVLLAFADEVEEVSKNMQTIFNKDNFTSILELVPDNWLQQFDEDADVVAKRKVYVDFLMSRLQHADIFVNEIHNARKALI